MADFSRFRRAQIGRCAHRNVLSTVNAGLERTVCESCGHVSVRFIDESVRVFSDPPRETKRRPQVCGSCDQKAVFMVPTGLACAEHAWAAAASQDLVGDNLWIPIKIDTASRYG